MSEAMHAAVPLLQDYLSDSARRAAGKVALVCMGRRLTYGELEAHSNAFAGALAQGGVSRGDRVLVFLDNTVEAVIAFWGTLKTNAAICIVNPSTKAAKLARLIEDSRPSALITDAHLHKAWAAPSQSTHLKTVVYTGTLDEEKRAKAPNATSWRDTLSNAEGALIPGRENTESDLAAIIYTSGSSGDSKGVILTHRNMLAAATSVSSYLQIDEDEVILAALPFSFDYGLYQMIMAFRQGARLVLERSFAFPGRVLKLMVDEGVTMFPGTPTIFAILEGLKSLRSFDLSKVRCITSTAAPLPPRHVRMLEAVFPRARIYSMYGLTECKRCTYLPPSDLEHKPASVGIPIPGVELWIVDENGQKVAPDTEGELVVRSAMVMQGYWGKPHETARRLRPGPLSGELVLYTGDRCKLDDEGYLYFVTRMDDVFKCRGEKVAPAEVEAVLLAIEGIREAAVVGVPDDILGHAVKAFVALQRGAALSEQEVRRACMEKLENFMIPKYVEFVSRLPRTDSGKIRKTALA